MNEQLDDIKKLPEDRAVRRKIIPQTKELRMGGHVMKNRMVSLLIGTIMVFTISGCAAQVDGLSGFTLLEHQSEDDSSLSGQMYDYYRTYEQTKEDIQNGYIVNTGVSFSEEAIPTATGGWGTSFYVNHDNSIDISITLRNLIDGTDRDRWTPDSFVSFDVYDPSGKAAYSFYEKGADIENEVDIDTELDVYPGEWRYKISFAYTTNGIDPSDMEIALRYKTIFEDDIQWLVDNKLK